MNTFKQVLWVLSIQFSVFFLLFMLFSAARQIYQNKTVANETHIHWTLYIDKTFGEEYITQIKEATGRWSKATNHLAEFDVEIISKENRNQIRHNADALVVTSLTEDSPDIISVDEENNETTIAFCNIRGPIATLAYVESRISDEDFEKVTMHELGHALKLKHVVGPDGIGQIMYPHTDLMGNVITQEDLQQFCKIYHCDATKLQHEEETFHP